MLFLRQSWQKSSFLRILSKRINLLLLIIGQTKVLNILRAINIEQIFLFLQNIGLKINLLNSFV